MKPCVANPRSRCCNITWKSAQSKSRDEARQGQRVVFSLSYLLVRHTSNDTDMVIKYHRIFFYLQGAYTFTNIESQTALSRQFLFRFHVSRSIQSDLYSARLHCMLSRDRFLSDLYGALGIKSAATLRQWGGGRWGPRSVSPPRALGPRGPVQFGVAGGEQGGRATGPRRLGGAGALLLHVMGHGQDQGLAEGPGAGRGPRIRLCKRIGSLKPSRASAG